MHDRCSQSKFRTAKYPAIHPPHNRRASKTATSEGTSDHPSRALRSERPVNFDNAAIAWGNPQNCLTTMPWKSQCWMADESFM
jgi:hypothetical protein